MNFIYSYIKLYYPMDQKLCKKCDIQKDLIFFNKDKSKNDGYRNSCKECQKNYSKN
jgi:hypothetical protein